MRGVAGIVVVLAAVVLAAAPSAARAQDPPFVNWPALLPALAPGFTENTFDLCRDGSPECIVRTLDEMDRRLRDFDRACDHNALFLRNYRLITQAYADLPAGFLDDPVYFAQEDAVFAQLYFDAEDAWYEGRHEDVPEAWRIAFSAAQERRVQGAGNLLLGINAHVQRDMPFLLAGLGLVDEEGRSRKPDHDRFNQVLSENYDDVLEQAREQDDPDLGMYDVPGTSLDGFLEFQGIAGWREGVWRNAERLVRAQTPAQRALVAQSIEANAATWARSIEAAFPYGGPFTPARRDALCAQRQAAERE